MRTGTHSDDTRTLSEYKVMMELIYMLASPSSCYFIREISKDCFKPIQSVSLCSISPVRYQYALFMSYSYLIIVYLSNNRKTIKFFYYSYIIFSCYYKFIIYYPGSALWD